MPECLFCNCRAGNTEHVFPRWILAHKYMGHTRMTVGDCPERRLQDAHLTVKTVCNVCNNGWMSALEAEIIPILSPIFKDEIVSFDQNQQSVLSIWVAKMAILLDSTGGRKASNRFYTKEEAVALRVDRDLPPFTVVLVGRLDHVARGITGTRFNTVQGGVKFNGCATTLHNERFVAQIVTAHIDPFPEGPATINITMKPGNWDLYLSRIWPPSQTEIAWPPPRSFKARGPEAYAHLIERWRLGTKRPFRTPAEEVPKEQD